MSMNKTLNLFIGFVAIMIIAFFAIGFTSQVQAPTNATALAQYNNLTNATGIAATGLDATMIIIVAAMLFSGSVGAMAMMRKR